MSEAERYVREVLRLIDAPPRAKRRIEADLRAHLEDALRAGEPAAEVVARMGSAAEVAAEFMAQTERTYARPWRWLKVLLVPLTVIYVVGVPYFILGWMGLQSLSADWSREALPFYALISTCGALSAIGVLLWKRWGVYGMAATWLANSVLNVIFPSPLQLGASIVGIALIMLFAGCVRRLWAYMT